MLPRFFDAAAITAASPWPRLVEALRTAFAGEHTAPDRHIHKIPVPGGETATGLLMPAWVHGERYGVKLVNVFPSNGAKGLPTVSSVYALFSAETGELLAILDGGTLTVRRTAATSVLAASYLARPDSETLLMVGAGRLAPLFIDAYREMLGIKRVLIWARRLEQAEAVAEAVAGVEPIADLAHGLAVADIVSTATLSRSPLVRGRSMHPGQHLDLVGAFSAEMRETDGEAVGRASVFIDTKGGSVAEAGDLIQAAAEGTFAWDRVQSDLHGLIAGAHPGRRSREEITLFKSVGAAIEDLATARLVVGETDR